MIETAAQLSTLLSVAVVNALTPGPGEQSFSSREAGSFSDPDLVELTAAQKREVAEIPLYADAEMPNKLEIDAFISVQLTERPNGVWRDYREAFIKGWNVSVKPEDFNLASIKREMTRQFLRLQRTARIGTLSGDDRETWGFIVDHINYAQYCEDTTVPVEFQGTLESRKNGQVAIRWVDGEFNSLVGVLAERMKYINAGESFVCRVKFKDSQVVEILDVAPVDPAQADVSWIQPLT